MKLSEKILYCRKKAGLSQEALADILGVSRQAVSKWETGDAVPELGKFSLLAKTFGVTADWLLSEDEATISEQTLGNRANSEKKGNAEPRNIAFDFSEPKRFIKKYGWIYGLYVSAGGALFCLIGILAAVISKKMIPDAYFDSFGTEVPAAMFNPVSIFGTAVSIIGGIVVIGGIILALYLKSRWKGSKK